MINGKLWKNFAIEQFWTYYFVHLSHVQHVWMCANVQPYTTFPGIPFLHKYQFISIDFQMLRLLNILPSSMIKWTRTWGWKRKSLWFSLNSLSLHSLSNFPRSFFSLCMFCCFSQFFAIEKVHFISFQLAHDCVWQKYCLKSFSQISLDSKAQHYWAK